MLQIIGAVVLFVFLNLVLPSFWQQFMSTAPLWLFNVAACLFIVACAVAVIASPPVYVRVINTRDHPIASVGLATAVVALTFASVWWLVARPYLASRVPATEPSFFATSTVADYPPGTMFGGIAWRRPFTDVRLRLSNPTNDAYKDLNLLLTPNQSLGAIGQVSSVRDVEFKPEHNMKMQMEVHRQSGERFGLPLVLIATEVGYRLKCAILAPKTVIEIVMAVVTIAGAEKDEPIENIFDKSYRVRFRVGEKAIWFGHQDAPDSIFGAKATPTTLHVEGSYVAMGQARTLTREVEIKDQLGDAAKAIRSGKAN